MTRCVNCGLHNTERTGASSSSELGTWCHTRCRDCGFRFYAFHSKDRFAKCLKKEAQDLILRRQTDVLADVIDSLRDLDIRTDDEIEVLDSILEILLDTLLNRQEISMETKEE